MMVIEKTWVGSSKWYIFRSLFTSLVIHKMLKTLSEKSQESLIFTHVKNIYWPVRDLEKGSAILYAGRLWLAPFLLAKQQSLTVGSL